MGSTKDKSPEYRKGYESGYRKGYLAGQKIKKESEPVVKKAYWIMRKDGWHCSNCLTKHDQAHNNFCCMCGRKMSEEADYEDN